MLRTRFPDVVAEPALPRCASVRRALVRFAPLDAAHQPDGRSDRRPEEGPFPTLPKITGIESDHGPDASAASQLHREPGAHRAADDVHAREIVLGDERDVESHTGRLLSVPKEIMRRNGVAVDVVRPVGMPIAHGVQPDMTEHGWPEDAWPALWRKIAAAEILIVGTPIWLGEESSVCRLMIERL